MTLVAAAGRQDAGGAAGRMPALRDALLVQTQVQADTKSSGCLTCHAGIEPMHASPAVKLGCTDCHGGNASTNVKEQAHVQPKNKDIFKTSANPPRT